MTKVYATVADRSAGDPILESDWDNYIKTNINNLIVPPVCVVYNSSDLLIPNNAFTDLTFNSESIDTDGMHSTSTNTNRITINTTGIYVMSLVGSFAADATGIRTLAIFVDGSDYLCAADIPANSVGGCTVSLTSPPIQLTSGQYVNAQAYQTSGGTLALTANTMSPYFSAHFVGRVS